MPFRVSANSGNLNRGLSDKKVPPFENQRLGTDVALKLAQGIHPLPVVLAKFDT